MFVETRPLVTCVTNNYTAIYKRYMESMMQRFTSTSLYVYKLCTSVHIILWLWPSHCGPYWDWETCTRRSRKKMRHRPWSLWWLGVWTWSPTIGLTQIPYSDKVQSFLSMAVCTQSHLNMECRVHIKYISIKWLQTGSPLF